MDFRVIWNHESGSKLYLIEVRVLPDGCELHWNKDIDKAIGFYSSEQSFVDKLMNLYFKGDYDYEYLGGFEK